MVHTLKLLFEILVFTAGFVTASRNRGFAFRLTGIYAGIFLAVLFLLVATGWYPRSAPTAIVHQAFGHIAVIYAWTGGMFSLGVCAVDFRLRPLRTGGRMLLLAMLFLAVLWGSFTGYLGPSRSTDSETVGRFWVLHGLVLPSLSLGIAGYWLWRASAEVAKV